jgi:hypothetical protein
MVSQLLRKGDPLDYDDPERYRFVKIRFHDDVSTLGFNLFFKWIHHPDSSSVAWSELGQIYNLYGQVLIPSERIKRPHTAVANFVEKFQQDFVIDGFTETSYKTLEELIENEFECFL